jgi:hypothetical protein
MIRDPRMAAVALAVSCTIRAESAVAQEQDPAAGETLFQEARRLMKSRDFASACPKLEESFRLDPATGTLVNLAGCEEQLGRTASAWQHWRAAADRLSAGDKRRNVALARASALEKVLPRLTISLAPSAPPDTRVKRDGTLLGSPSLGVALPLDPGRHTVVASAAGRQDREIEVVLQDRDQRSLVVEPGPVETTSSGPVAPVDPAPVAASTRAPAPDLPPPRSVDRAPGSTGSSSVLGYALLGTGALGLGAGAFFGLSAAAARREASSLCPDASGASVCWSSASDSLDRDKRYSLYADVGFAVGLVTASAGLYLLLRPHADAPATTAAFVPLSQGGAVQLAGKF